MTNPDDDNAQQRLIFGRYVLDLRRSRLLLDNREIAMQPQTFAVLKYLATHPGQLIGADELIEEVWPDLRSADQQVVKSMEELRHALGDSGARLISAGQRGFQFDPDAAAPDRRQPRQWRPLRWRWIYGILAPLALLLTFVVLWLIMRA